MDEGVNGGRFYLRTVPRVPAPSVGKVKGVEADRRVGLNVGDKAPAGTSRSDGVVPEMSDPERSLFVDRPVYLGHGWNYGEVTTRVQHGQKRGYFGPGDQRLYGGRGSGRCDWGSIGDLPPVVSAGRDTVIEEVQRRDAQSGYHRICPLIWVLILHTSFFPIHVRELTDHPGWIRPMR